MAVSKEHAEHYRWGEQCDGWILMNRPGCEVIQERMPLGTQERKHRHLKASQFFYVLSGTLVLEVEGRTVELPPYHGEEVQAGLAHQVFNRSSGPVEFLVLSQPSTRGDREDCA